MILPYQKQAIDKKNDTELRRTISMLTVGNTTNKDELIAYCESRLDDLNVDNAIVEYSEVDLSDF
jgi:hypothetical protein